MAFVPLYCWSFHAFAKAGLSLCYLCLGLSMSASLLPCGPALRKQTSRHGHGPVAVVTATTPTLSRRDLRDTP
ncbi:uncharacterized protein B0H64DRAFT_394708 [Chaetomium fimeti]|uniref:Uncharacterized protein n=1 Tax=Chaetomium fimeti TaxID=1854472 RepID=A0AAE0HF15_9PEZI|nr:hypothetical protein B0H64DRAFT_394708 [Chaetomium fimeti]